MTQPVDPPLPMKEVYGHEASFNMPLELVFRAKGSLDVQQEARARGWVKKYAEWLSTSQFGRFVCFVDITFLPIGAKRPDQVPMTLVVTPGEEQAQEYSRRLTDEFFRGGWSVAAHPVFQEGLPRYRTPNGERIVETANGLSEARENKWELVDDGFLLWASSAISSNAPEHTDATAKLCEFIGTYGPTFPDPNLQLMQLKRGPSISEVWDAYVHVFSRPGLHSGSGGSQSNNVGILGAVPIGIRDDKNRYFSLAQLYFGLSGEARKAYAIEFMRLLSTHLLKTNAGFHEQIRGSQMLLQTIGHELSKVTAPITSGWTPAASDLFSVEVEGQETQQACKSMLGRIVLNADDVFLKESLGVIPFIQQMRTLGSAIRFWSYSDGLHELPFGGKIPETWSDLVPLCWDAARNYAIISALNTELANTPETVRETFGNINLLRRLFDYQRPDEIEFDPDFISSFRLDLKALDLEQRRPSFALARILIATFGNCLRHGDFTKSAKVSVKQKRDEPTRFLLKVFNVRPQPSAERVATLMKLAPEDARALLEKLASARISQDGTERLYGSTAQVIETSLKILEGEAEIPQQTENSYEVSFEFLWR